MTVDTLLHHLLVEAQARQGPAPSLAFGSPLQDDLVSWRPFPPYRPEEDPDAVAVEPDKMFPDLDAIIYTGPPPEDKGWVWLDLAFERRGGLMFFGWERHYAVSMTDTVCPLYRKLVELFGPPDHAAAPLHPVHSTEEIAAMKEMVDSVQSEFWQQPATVRFHDLVLLWHHQMLVKPDNVCRYWFRDDMVVTLRIYPAEHLGMTSACVGCFEPSWFRRRIPVYGAWSVTA